MEISESNGFSCCCLVSLPASYEKQHYQGYKYNQTTTVVLVLAERKYFLLVLLFLCLQWLNIAVWNEYCHRDINFWYLHLRNVVFGKFARPENKHLEDRNALPRRKLAIWENSDGINIYVKYPNCFATLCICYIV